MRRIRRLLPRALLAAVLGLMPVVPALANHGPPARSATDQCNGANGFDINNVITSDLVDAIAAQNQGSRNLDGTIDRTKIAHALISASGHAALQVRETPGTPLARVTFEFAPTNSAWNPSSTNHPGYLTAIEAREDPARDIDGDLVLGNTFVFLIPTDVVSDGNYVARLRGFKADGTEVGRLCLDSIVANGQGLPQALDANRNPAYEPAARAGLFAPQPILWFPAGEPSAAQQAGYGAKVLRIEFIESLAQASLKIEREEDLPAPTGLVGTASSTGGSLATGTYFYKVTALNANGETLPSNEIGVAVTGPTGSVSLTWGAVPGATGYRVYRGTSAGGENVFYASTTNSFVDTNAAGTPGTPNSGARAKIWVDYTTLLGPDDLARPHFLAGGRMDETPLEPLANNKVWGPGFKFAFGSLPGEGLPAERLRITAQDRASNPFCGIYTFSAGANDSFLASSPATC